MKKINAVFMKHDIDLMIQILERIESEETKIPLSSLSIDGYPDYLISNHLIFMTGENLLKGRISRVDGQQQPAITINGITHKGYDLLERSREENVDRLIASLDVHHNSQKLEDSIPKEGDLSPDVINSMQDIIRLVNTGDLQKKQDAIGIFIQNRKDIPDDFAFEFLRGIWTDKDSAVKKNLPVRTFEEFLTFIERGLFTNPKIVEKYYDSLEQALKKVSDTVRVFDLSHSTAKALKHSLINPDMIFPHDLIARFSREQGEMAGNVPASSQLGLHSSPIGSLSDLIQSLPQEDDTRNGSQTFTRDRREKMRRQLDDIVITDMDISFNIPGYELLFTLERMLRDLIHQRIIIPHKKDLISKIPADVLLDMKTRKLAEETSDIVEKTYELIEYCDFTHLKKILDKGRNWEFFRDIFTEEEMRGVYAKLGELDPIRKKVAHSRPLTRDEFERLRLYASDIFKKLKKNTYPN